MAVYVRRHILAEKCCQVDRKSKNALTFAHRCYNIHLAAAMRRRVLQEALFINNVKQVQGAQSRNKRSKNLKIVKTCIMRASIAVISLVTFVSYALVRAYLLLTIEPLAKPFF